MLRINNKERQRILEIHRNNSMKPWLYKLLNEKWEVTDDPGSEFEMNPAGPVPFKNQTEGDAFRKWVHTNYPQIAEEENLALSYPEYNNKYIKNVWNRFDLRMKKYLGDIYTSSKRKKEDPFLQSIQSNLTQNYDKTIEPLNPIQDKIIPTHPNFNSRRFISPESKSSYTYVPTWPLKNNIEGDEFRYWVWSNHPNIAKLLNLSIEGGNSDSFKNATIAKAWNYPYFATDVTKKLGDWYYLDIKSEIDRPIFYKRLLPLLEDAKKWWRNWLSFPETRIKFKKLNGIWFDSTVDYWFNKYFDCINNVKIEIYYSVSKSESKLKEWGNSYGRNVCLTAYACVSFDNPYQINVNLGYEPRSDKDWTATLIHEIQHLIFFIKPMTPEKSISKFRNDDGCYDLNREKYAQVDVEEKDIKIFGELKVDDKKIKEISSDLGIDVNKTKEIVKNSLRFGYENWTPEYFKDNSSEISSRVIGSKYLLFGTSRNDFIKSDFVNYLKNNQSQPQVNFLLGWWAVKGFPPMQEFVNDLNTSFVKTDKIDQKSSPLDLPYKPKTNYA